MSGVWALVHVLAFIAGLAIVISVIGSIINTIITPRAISSLISYVTWLCVRGIFMALANRRRRYEQKDRILAYLAPVAVLSSLVTWLGLYTIGYALMFWSMINADFGVALHLSGSSLFTLGVVSSHSGGPISLEFITAATGVITVALQIGYLPTLYGSYNRRESLVTMLGARAGTPAWGPELLARHYLSQSVDTLPALYAQWESWAADMSESHTSYAWLLAFRSPNRLNSWIVALLAVMDSAALYSSLCPSTCPSEARQCIRMGFMALRAVTSSLRYPVNDDPHPDDPIQLTYDEFVAGVEVVSRVGFPFERTPEEAWPHFKGWRVNYEDLVYWLANEIVAVPAPWSGVRPLMTHDERFELFTNRPRHRTPNDPEGTIVLNETVIAPAAGRPLGSDAPPSGRKNQRPLSAKLYTFTWPAGNCTPFGKAGPGLE